MPTPTEPGWYWWRDTGRGGPLDWEVVRVYVGNLRPHVGELRCALVGMDGEGAVDDSVSGIGGEWGPRIPSPPFAPIELADFVHKAVATMPEDDASRTDFLYELGCRMCLGCGRTDERAGGCQCWNDE